jgi:hypothetical protein
MLRLTAERTKKVLREPALFVLQQALVNYAVTYQLNVYCDCSSFTTNLHRNVLMCSTNTTCSADNDPYVADPLEPKVVAQDQWFAKPATQPNIGTETAGIDPQVTPQQRRR